MQARRVVDRLAEREIALELQPEARELIGDLGYDPVYGARPLKRVLEKKLVDVLALAMLQGEIRDARASSSASQTASSSSWSRSCRAAWPHGGRRRRGRSDAEADHRAPKTV